MSMHIGILSRNRNLYSTRRLIEAAHERSHVVSVMDTLAVAVELGIARPSQTNIRILSKTPIGLARVESAPKIDAIIPRIGASITFYGLAVVRQFEAQKVLTTAVSEGIAISRDKLQSLQCMQANGLPIPKTAVIAQSQALFAAVETVGGLPVVIKLIRGTQGRGVVLAPNLATAAEVLRRIQAADRQALVQEYIAEAQGCDLRVIVVGNRCVAAMQRRAADGEFRANLHMGGTAVSVELDRQTQQLAINAAKAHNLGVAGVDLIYASRGPLLLEVNSSPGLEGIESITGVDVAGEIIGYLERAYRKQKQNRR